MSFIQSSSFNVLYTRKLKETGRFYKSIGSEIKESTKDKVVVGIGDFDLHFILGSREPFGEYKYIAESNEYGNGNIFYLESDSLEEDFNRIKDAGGVIKSEIFNNLWSCKEFLFEDPNGYKFAVYE
jgi:predicted enzyme related to lactoylglutathione lyase